MEMQAQMRTALWLGEGNMTLGCLNQNQKPECWAQGSAFATAYIATCHVWVDSRGDTHVTLATTSVTSFGSWRRTTKLSFVLDPSGITAR
jgi:hypothetical protein